VQVGGDGHVHSPLSIIVSIYDPEPPTIPITTTRGSEAVRMSTLNGLDM